MCSLGIEPTTFALLTQCSYHWATEHSLPSEISHGYDYVFNRLCQKQVEAWFMSSMRMWHILSTLVSSLWHFLWIICLSLAFQLEMMTRTHFHPSTRMLHQLQLGPQNQKIAPLQFCKVFSLFSDFPLPIYLAMHLHCKIHLQLSFLYSSIPAILPLFSDQ